MNSTTAKHIDALRANLQTLADGGGRVSASVYDTAQVLRLLGPIDADPGPTLAWLEQQQHDDGGWGDRHAPMGRTAPTLAALLALHAFSHAPEAQDRAQDFLVREAARWAPPLPDDIPIGAELVVPRLLEEASAAGLPLDLAPYAALCAMGDRRRALIARFQPRAGTTPMHSWEAWGTAPSDQDLDGAGSLGHSPAATAAWLHAAIRQNLSQDARNRAATYLRAASLATGTNVPGTMPTVYPIDRFEKLWPPYALVLAGLQDEPWLRDVLAPLLDDTAGALARFDGLGFADTFAPDGDDTAAGIVILLAGGRSVSVDALEQFREGEHFCTWHREMNVSLSTTTRAIHALAMAGRDVVAHRDYVVRRQDEQGRWTCDKWHRSWLYSTCHAIIALAGSDAPTHRAALERGLETVRRAQREDGGWSTNGNASSATETAYAVLTLLSAGATNGELQHAHEFLAAHIGTDHGGYWIGKEDYRPARVDETFEQIALVALDLRNT